MSYRTMEVELNHGQVRPSPGEALPPKARALLTILNPIPDESDPGTGPSIVDLAGDLVGIGNGKLTDLSSNKAHLDDFGR